MIAFYFLLGAIFGSFANVLILRLPDEESIITDSHCRACKAPVGWLDNIPIFSWFILRGKCRKCKAPFSFQYVVVEITMATLFTFSYLKLGGEWYLYEFLIFVFAAVTASFIDLKHYILPDVFTLGGLVIAFAGSFINPERSYMDSLIGLLVGGGFFYAIAYLYFIIRKQEGMGGGDIKLLAWIGALMGWQAIPFVVFFSGLTGGCFGFARTIVKRGGFHEPLPFGPFLVASALIYVLGAQTIVQWYLEIIGLQ